MPLYLVNIGNTHTQIAVIQDGEPLLLARYDTPKLIDDNGSVPLFDGTSEPWRAVASSVVPRLKEKMAFRNWISRSSMSAPSAWTASPTRPPPSV